jgi:hypothetical protein
MADAESLSDISKDNVADAANAVNDYIENEAANDIHTLSE